MKPRDRFNTVLSFERCDRCLLFELFMPWPLTVEKWVEQGMKRDWWEYGNFDIYSTFHDIKNLKEFKAPVNLGLLPPFEAKVLEEDDEYIVTLNEWGIKEKNRKNRSSMPQFLEYPVKEPKDWESLKERLNPYDPARYPKDWDNFVSLSNACEDRPLMIHGFPFGIFGTPRELLGAEEFLVAFYTMPDIIHDMMNYLADFWIRALSKAVSELKIDYAIIWEDMAGKQGSLISPAMFREFMLEPYKRLCGFYKESGIRNIFVDTDGACMELIPLFLEGGVTGLFPFEVQAGMDVREVRKAFPRLQIIGGLDKRALAKGKDAIDKELESKVPFMLKYGGYIPCLDHLIPPDVPFENFVYYMKKLEEVVKGFGPSPAF